MFIIFVLLTITINSYIHSAEKHHDKVIVDTIWDGNEPYKQFAFSVSDSAHTLYKPVVEIPLSGVCDVRPCTMQAAGSNETGSAAFIVEFKRKPFIFALLERIQNRHPICYQMLDVEIDAITIDHMLLCLPADYNRDRRQFRIRKTDNENINNFRTWIGDLLDGEYKGDAGIAISRRI